MKKKTLVLTIVVTMILSIGLCGVDRIFSSDSNKGCDLLSYNEFGMQCNDPNEGLPK